MLVRKFCFVALTLTLVPTLACKKKSNTTEQNQSNTMGSPPPAVPSSAGSDTNPNAPNPSGAEPGTPMSPPAMGSGAPVVGDAGVDAGPGSAGSAGSKR